MNKTLRSKLAALSTLLLVVSTAHAATDSSTVAVSGTVSDSTSCSINAPASIAFGSVTTEAYHSQPVNIGINCSNGRSYSLTEQTPNNIPLGRYYAYLTTINDNGTSLDSAPVTGTGSGVEQTAALTMRLHGPSGPSSNIAVGAVGSFNVNVTYTLTF